MSENKKGLNPRIGRILEIKESVALKYTRAAAENALLNLKGYKDAIDRGLPDISEQEVARVEDRISKLETAIKGVMPPQDTRTN